MNAFHLITSLEGPLKAHIQLKEKGSDQWLMLVKLFYNGDVAGTTSFTLQGYTKDEAEETARNLKTNAFLMREIDEFLWGESD